MHQASPLLRLVLSLAEARSPQQAAQAVLAGPALGLEPDEVLRSVVGAVLKETGQRWQRALLGTAQEHLVTAWAQAMLTALSHDTDRSEVPSRGRLVVAVAEDEGHTLPSRMLALQLSWDGWDVTDLGGSLPSGDIADWLAHTRPLAIAASCAMPLHLPGLLAVADAARAAGVPCVAGGSGLGVDPTRAAALGLRWAPSAAGVPAAAAAPPPAEPPELPARRAGCAALLAAVPAAVQAATVRFALDNPEVAAWTSREWALARQDFEYVLRMCAAALLTGDAAVFCDFAEWLQIVLTSRGLPDTLLPRALRALGAVVPRTHRDARALLTSETVHHRLAGAYP